MFTPVNVQADKSIFIPPLKLKLNIHLLVLIPVLNTFSCRIHGKVYLKGKLVSTLA